MLGPAVETILTYLIAAAVILFVIAFPTRKFWMRACKRQWRSLLDQDRIEMERIRTEKEHRQTAEAEVDNLFEEVKQPPAEPETLRTTIRRDDT